MFEGLAYRVAWRASGGTYDAMSDPAHPLMRLPNISSVCFTDAPFDVQTVMTSQAILNEYAQEATLHQSSALSETQRQAAFDVEIANDFCAGELATVKAAVDAQIDDWVTIRQAEINATTNFATLKTALRDQTIPAIGQMIKGGLKKVVGCVRARAR